MLTTWYLTSNRRAHETARAQEETAAAVRDILSQVKANSARIASQEQYIQVPELVLSLDPCRFLSVDTAREPVLCAIINERPCFAWNPPL